VRVECVAAISLPDKRRIQYVVADEVQITSIQEINARAGSLTECRKCGNQKHQDQTQGSLLR